MHLSKRTVVDIAALAELFPHRVARAADLILLGLPPEEVQVRCRPGGGWQRPFPGVLLLSSRPPTADQLAMAALRYTGDETLLTGQSGLRLHGIPPARAGPIHVLLPYGRHLSPAPGLLLQRARRLPSVLVRRGLRVASLARSTADAVRRSESRVEVRWLLAAAIGRGVGPDLLRRELTGPGHRYPALALDVLAELCEHVAS